MKKLISCLLAVLLVCSVMSMNVFADTTDRVVGNGPTPDVNDGVGTFDPSEGLTGSNTDINVNFGQDNTKGEDTNGDGIPDTDTPVNGGDGTTIVHKYAVDITYGEFLLDLTKVDLGGENVPGDANGDDIIDNGETVFVPYYMVWDVNNYKYVLCKKEGETYVPVTPSNTDVSGGVNEETGADEPNNVPDALETPFTLDSTVMVTNHSDLSVFTTLVLTNGRTDINWEITAAVDSESEATATEGDNIAIGEDDTATATEEITKATAETTAADGTVNAGSATNGSTYYFTATPAAADGWLGVVGNLLNEANTVVIGNITITIDKNA